MNDETLKIHAVEMLRTSAGQIGTHDNPRLNALAQSSLRFAAIVFDHLVERTHAATATVTVGDSPTLPTPVAPPHRNEPDASAVSKSTRRRGRRTRPKFSVAPSEYVNKDAINYWREKLERRDTPIRSVWGRRADTFLAVAILNDLGITATAQAISTITGIAPHNCGAHLNDLWDVGVLERFTVDGRAHWQLTEIVAEELSK